MDLSSKIYVAGHTGLVGSAITRGLKGLGYKNLLVRHRRELDLTDRPAVQEFFAAERPEYVFLAAARVGGISANANYPADFIRDNLLIQTNVVDAAHGARVKRLLFLGSSCIYPKHAQQPIKEEYLLTGPIEPTNRPYAVAKIAGIEMCWSYNRQYATQFLAAMPTNLYGPGDRYDLNDSHVLPALIRKMHEAKENGAKEVMLWGTGTPRREFLYSEDAAEACILLMNLPPDEFNPLISRSDTAPIVNIGRGEDLTIRQLAEIVAEVTGFQGEIIFDPAMPDGTPRKLLDTTRLQHYGWRPRTPLRAGIQSAYADFKIQQLRHNEALETRMAGIQ